MGLTRDAPGKRTDEEEEKTATREEEGEERGKPTTTTTPEAVRMGLARRKGTMVALYWSGTPPMMSTI